MTLPNEHFKDFPIEYKQLNEGDFSYIDLFGGNPDGFEIKKTTLEIEKNQYLNDSLQKEINLEEKNTVVINSPVGKGKSYAIIQTIKRFYDDPEKYLIIVATPFVSLVEQYCKDIHEDGDIPTNQIYNYGSLGRDKTPYIDKNIQVLTANTLLGNPGDDSYKNSDIKRTYLNELVGKCEENNIKVVFIYDEIHDTIKNFKEEFIFNLWKWKKVLHKNFIISATFSEASKVVIEYLAELTDKKIHIIETERDRNFSKQSKLILHYSAEHRFTTKTLEIRSALTSLINSDKNVDVLCYSKKLAQEIIKDKELGGKLAEKFGVINDCTSENIDNERPDNAPPQNRFDNERCNIGTNFKSGVSITKEDHAFVIIMPSRHTIGKFKNNYGIFSGGVNSVIQALARQRKKGEIHIILSKPDPFDYESLPRTFTEEQVSVFKKHYDKVSYYKEDLEKVQYFPQRLQLYYLNEFYEDILKKNVLKGIKYAQETKRIGLASLDFPSYKNFVLNRGEDYLADTYSFFGGELSAYITYCAFTNQFINCNLSEISYKTNFTFQDNHMQFIFGEALKRYWGEEYFQTLRARFNFRLAYLEFRNELFKVVILQYRKEKGEKITKIKSFKNPHLEKQLLRFVAFMYYGNNYHLKEDYKTGKEDLDYSRSQYFLDAIKSASNINLEESTFTEIDKQRIIAYKNLGYFREKLISQKRPYNRGAQSYEYLPVKPDDNFITTSELPRFTQLITYLVNEDDFISNNVYEFTRRVNTLDITKNINSFYTILVEDLIVLEDVPNPRIDINGKREYVRIVSSIKPLPISNNHINLVQPAEYLEFINSDTTFEELAINNYGSVEGYNSFMCSFKNSVAVENTESILIPKAETPLIYKKNIKDQPIKKVQPIIKTINNTKGEIIEIKTNEEPVGLQGLMSKLTNVPTQD
jgi:hypothetical protein